MKIKFVKNYLSYKADQIEVIEDKDTASHLVDKGYAVEVVEAVDGFDEVVKNLESKITEAAEKAATEAANKAVEKVSKGLSKIKPSIVVGVDRADEDPNAGFKNLGEFAKAVKAKKLGGSVDERITRLINKTAGATPTGSGLSDADGLVTIPVGFSNQVFDGVKASDKLFPYIDAMPITGRIMTIPCIKHYDFSNSTATAGLVATYRTEGDIQAASKAQWEKLTFTVKTLAALVPTTEELEEDSGIALAQWLNAEGARQIDETISNNILNTVAGGATPILGHASVVQNLRDTVDNISYQDLVRVYARFYGDYSKAVWIVHPTTLPEIADVNSGNQNMFTPAGIQGFPFNQLMGRPLIVSQYAPALGLDGDVGLYDLSKYKAVYKAEGVTSAMSMHLYFDSFQNAYRFAFRWDGKPGLTSQITLKDGTTKVSPFSILNRDHTQS